MSWFTTSGQKDADKASERAGGALYRYLFKAGSGFAPITPTEKGCGLTFTPLCAVDFNHHAPGQPAKLLIDPTTGKSFDRYSSRPDDFTSWFFRAPGVIRLGKMGKQITIIFREWDARNRSNHPYGLVLDTAWKAHHMRKKQQLITTPLGTSESEGWADLLRTVTKEDGKQEYKSLNNVDTIHFFPSLVYALGNAEGGVEYIKDGAPLGAAEGDDIPVVVMSSSAAANLKQQLNTLANPDLIPDPNDLSCLRYPSIVGSLFVHMYSLKTNSCPAMKRHEQEKWAGNATRAGTSWGNTSRQTKTEDKGAGMGYAAFLSKTYEGTVQSGTTINYDDIFELSKERLKHPDDYIEMVSNDDLPEILLESGIPMGLLYEAFKDHPRWIPERVKDAVAARHSVAVPEKRVEREVPQQLPTDTDWIDANRKVSNHLNDSPQVTVSNPIGGALAGNGVKSYDEDGNPGARRVAVGGQTSWNKVNTVDPNVALQQVSSDLVDPGAVQQATAFLGNLNKKTTRSVKEDAASLPDPE